MQIVRQVSEPLRERGSECYSISIWPTNTPY